MTRRADIIVTGFLGLVSLLGYSQQPTLPPPLHPADKPSILFAVEDRTGEKDDSGKPAQSTLDPIAFLVDGQLRGCSTPGPPPTQQDAGEALALQHLRKAYSGHKTYPVWFGGEPWGQAQATASCIEDVTPGDSPIDWQGCFQLHPGPEKQHLPKQSYAIAYTGPESKPTHETIRAKASSAERALFLETAASIYAQHHVRVAPRSIHVGSVWKTQLHAGHPALAGSTLVQFPLKDANKWSSVRIFLVLEESDGHYAPVLSQVHKTTIPLDANTITPKPGEILDEGEEADRETFLDNFPLYPSEPDSIMSYHQYYEDWSYSIYRRRGTTYQLVYTGCGGGD